MSAEQKLGPARTNERYGKISVLPGAEKAIVKFAFEEAHTLPGLVPSTEAIIKANTTNGRGIFQERDEVFRGNRWNDTEDSLALTASLGAMEFSDRRRFRMKSEDASFLREVYGELNKVAMVHGNVDVPKSESSSTWNRSVTSVIEATTTDSRGFEPVGRVRKDNIEDSLAVRERLGWMTLDRASVIHMSTAKKWSFDNYVARVLSHNTDEPQDGESHNIILVTTRDKNEFLGDIIRGNLNAHFGLLAKGSSGFPMLWDGEFAAENLDAISASNGGPLVTDLFEGHAAHITSPTKSV